MSVRKRKSFVKISLFVWSTLQNIMLLKIIVLLPKTCWLVCMHLMIVVVQALKFFGNKKTVGTQGIASLYRPPFLFLQFLCNYGDHNFCVCCTDNSIKAISNSIFRNWFDFLFFLIVVFLGSFFVCKIVVYHFVHLGDMVFSKYSCSYIRSKPS